MIATLTNLRRFTQVQIPSPPNAPSFALVANESLAVDPTKIAVIAIDVGAPGHPCAAIEENTLTRIKPLVDAVRAAGGKIFHTPSVAAGAHPALLGPGDTDFAGSVTDVPSHTQTVIDGIRAAFNGGWPQLIIHVGYDAAWCLPTRPAGIGPLFWLAQRQPDAASYPFTAKFLLPCDCTMAREIYGNAPLRGPQWEAACQRYASFIEGRSYTCWEGQMVIDALGAA